MRFIPFLPGRQGPLGAFLARRDAEQLGIEAGDAVEEAAVAREHLPGCIGVVVEQRVDVPSVRGGRR